MRRGLRSALAWALALSMALSPLAPVGQALALDQDEEYTAAAQDDEATAPVEAAADGDAAAVAAPDDGAAELEASEVPEDAVPSDGVSTEDEVTVSPQAVDELEAEEGLAPEAADELPAPEEPEAEGEPLRAAAEDGGEAALGAGLVSGVPYVKRSWNGSEVVSESVTQEEATSVPSDGSMTSGWYYLDSNVTVSGRISLAGDTYLVLKDGCTLDVGGIYVPSGTTLTVYAQSDGNKVGKINSHPSEGAAIGAMGSGEGVAHPGGSIEIHGGRITAEGASHCAGIGSNDGNGTTAPITIYGGTVNARGGSDGAGIGGGRDCDGGDITIYGGTVNARGGTNAAGIGGGDSSSGGTITIWGGTITANEDPEEDGAGIGGGDGGDGGTITINGGTVTTYSRDGAGIGGGDGGDGGTIAINGGAVTCWDKGHAQGARIGGGCDGDGESITITDGTVDVYFRDGAGIGGGEDGDGGTISISGGKVTTHPEGVGNGAGIGGGNHSGKGGTITITGGVVNANGRNSAGIGGGRAREAGLLEGGHPNSGSGGVITITGGEVHAMSEMAIAIGAGGDNASHDYWNDTIGSAGTITIGGKVKLDAYGRLGGIGGDSGTINIQGGDVNVGGLESSGWGYGIHLRSDDKGFVNISGGKVTATGIGDFAGISTENATVTISGGTVEASSEKGAGIGAQEAYHNTAEGTLIIEGENTYVKATSDSYAIGGKDSGKGTWIFRDGAKIEVINRESCSSYNVNVLYKGARIIAGDTKDTATVLLAGERKNAYKNNKYRLIEPCDHPERDENGLCLYCENQEGNYIERSWDGTKVVSEEKPSPEGTLSFPKEKTVKGGWYFLNQDISINGRVTLEDDTNLILGDGCTLDVKGISVPSGKTLTVYAQSDGESAGRIVSRPTSGGAAIGGWSGNNNGAIVIHGGRIEATGDDHCAGIGANDGKVTGTITIYGGDVTATGGSQGAGIGGGRGCDGGTITIYGGTVTATGTDSSAGIGGGDPSDTRADDSTIEIHGGTVTATGNSKGSGIGGGEYGRATITVTGGTVTATGGSTGGAGIGSGADGEASAITITGGIIDATAPSGGGCGIGNGKNKTGSTVSLGYTDATRKTIRIAADSYGSTVTIENDFYSIYGLFRSGWTGDLANLAQGPLRAWSDELVTWRNLALAISGAESGSIITLDRDFVAVDGDNDLVVEGKTLTIDLNGHTLNRNLDENSDYDGSVFVVKSNASLTIVDSEGGGTITGACSNHGGIDCAGTLTLNGGIITGNVATQTGGGVFCSGTMTMNGGKITGNTSMRDGGAIYCTGTLTLNGGTIASNTATGSGGGVCLADGANLSLHDSTIKSNVSGGDGGGVYVAGTATMVLSGGARVKGNTSGGSRGNVYLADNGDTPDDDCALITFDGALNDDAEVYVSRPGTGVFTSGYREHNAGSPDALFYADDSDYVIALIDDEAAIINKADAVTVTFNSDGGDDVPSQSVVTGGTATRPDDPAREGYRFKGWYRVDPDTGVDSTVFDFDTAISEDITLKAKWNQLWSVAVYTSDTACTTSVANATVDPLEDRYETDESVTVSVPDVPGWDFDGWYPVTEVGTTGLVSSYDGGNRLSGDLSYTFEVTQNVRLVAVYRADAQANVTIAAKNGAAYAVSADSGAAVQTSVTSWQVPVGQTVTVTAADSDSVLQWENESSKVIGKGSSLTFVVTGSMKVTLVYGTAEESHAFVEFMTDYDQVLSAGQYATGDAIAFPDGPSKFGYTFKWWRIEGETERATQDTIHDRIAAGDTLVTLRPYYERSGETGSITVRYEYGGEEFYRDEYQDVTYGTTKTLTAAAEKDGRWFKCWTDASGKVLGYDPTLWYKVAAPATTFVAQYVDAGEAFEAVPTINVTEFSALDAGGVHKVSCVVTRSVPEGYTMVEHGLLYGGDVDGALLADDGALFVYDGGANGIKRYKSNDMDRSGFVRSNFKVADDNVRVSCRGFMVLRKNGSDELLFRYSDVVTRSYASAG